MYYLFVVCVYRLEGVVCVCYLSMWCVCVVLVIHRHMLHLCFATLWREGVKRIKNSFICRSFLKVEIDFLYFEFPVGFIY